MRIIYLYGLRENVGNIVIQVRREDLLRFPEYPVGFVISFVFARMVMDSASDDFPSSEGPQTLSGLSNGRPCH